jgi:hypothetical protein
VPASPTVGIAMDEAAVPSAPERGRRDLID